MIVIPQSETHLISLYTSKNGTKGKLLQVMWRFTKFVI